ncbi:hypothetical protein GGQ74_002304 [Desulfobaculum xiamenense]|uniref:Uncharacterized protein n=1 Tax=Desulfobaculum xiamenense TaxID=995050 RepID=A0A846QKH0_9BACT|nr:hypothetical protein [Desulfobaculum xiamenense]NJB68631.1 hypothetical protein [Desulfobaculum xiamenense]
MDETLYIATLFLGPTAWPRYAAIAAAGFPALILGWATARRYGALRGTVWGLVHCAIFYGLLKLTSGAYAYSLYTWVSPHVDAGTTGILSTDFGDRMLVFVLPALAHGAVAAVLGIMAMGFLSPGPPPRSATSRAPRRKTRPRRG